MLSRTMIYHHHSRSHFASVGSRRQPALGKKSHLRSRNLKKMSEMNQILNRLTLHDGTQVFCSISFDAHRCTTVLEKIEHGLERIDQLMRRKWERLLIVFDKSSGSIQ
jgi:hypothetical protein